jgi:hypothetical protein
VGLERGPLSLVITTEELLEKKSYRFCPENRDYGCRGTATALYPQKLALTSPTSCDSSATMIRSRTKATEFVLFGTSVFNLPIAQSKHLDKLSTRCMLRMGCNIFPMKSWPTSLTDDDMPPFPRWMKHITVLSKVKKR